MYVSGPDRMLRCVVDGERVGLLSVACTNDDPGLTFTVDFSSPVRVSGDGNQHTGTDFSISLSGQKKVVTGSVSVNPASTETRIILAPRSPDWAVSRIISTSMRSDGTAVMRETRILEGN